MEPATIAESRVKKGLSGVFGFEDQKEFQIILDSVETGDRLFFEDYSGKKWQLVHFEKTLDSVI